VDGRETVVVFAVPLVTTLFFLQVVMCVFLESQAVEVFFQHTAVLELVVCPSLMIRAWLL